LPGHFMVRYTPEAAQEQIVDVHGGGEFLSRTQAQEKIIETTGTGFRDADYRRATKREIIVRMLRNLMSPAERDESLDPLRYLEVIVALEPNSAADRLRRALLRLQNGDATGAKADFRWMLDRQPAGIDLERV